MALPFLTRRVFALKSHDGPKETRRYGPPQIWATCVMSDIFRTSFWVSHKAHFDGKSINFLLTSLDHKSIFLSFRMYVFFQMNENVITLELNWFVNDFSIIIIVQKYFPPYEFFTLEKNLTIIAIYVEKIHGLINKKLWI